MPWNAARPDLERAFRLDRLGVRGPTRGQADGRYWRAVGPGWFRPIEPPSSVEQRIVEASYRLPPGQAVTGWAALRWMGGRWFDGRRDDLVDSDVPLTCLGARRVHTPGVRLTKERLQPGDLTRLDGLAVTTAVRSVTFEMRHAPSLRDALVALDMACYNDLVSLEEVRDWVAAGSGWTGIQQARDALALADENAWSPAEVGLRWLWTQVGQLGPVLSNRPVFDLRGRHLLTPDLVDPVAGVVGEYQGGHHFERAQRRRDLARETLLRDHGLEYVERVAGEDETLFLIRLRSAYARARRIDPAVRRWTLTPPSTWTPTDTVAQRRNLPPHQRSALLSHRWLRPAA